MRTYESLTWNKLWFPSPHGNRLLRILKYSYGTNSGRWPACFWCSKYALSMHTPTAGIATKNDKRFHNFQLPKMSEKKNKHTWDPVRYNIFFLWLILIYNFNCPSILFYPDPISLLIALESINISKKWL